MTRFDTNGKCAGMRSVANFKQSCSLRGSSLRVTIFCALIMMFAGMGCDNYVQPSKDMYFLVDVSKSYATYSERSLTRLQAILGSVKPGDRLTVGKIQSCSYSDESVLLPTRSLTLDEDSAYRNIGQLGMDLKALQGTLSPTQNTDIKGAFIMVSQHFRRSRSRDKVLILFSDLRDDPQPNCAAQSESLIDLSGVIVVFADVSISQTDELNAGGRMERINTWVELVKRRGAKRVELVQGVFEVQAVLDELALQ